MSKEYSRCVFYIQETINAQVYSNFILKLSFPPQIKINQSIKPSLPVPNTAVEVEGRSTGEL